MFERIANYPSGITVDGAANPEAAQREALSWVISRHKELGGQVLLFVPQKGSLSHMDNLIGQFSRLPEIAVGTWKGRVTGWRGGVVLAAWPSREKLAEIADDPRTRALCVIPWGLGEVSAWEIARKPELLGAAQRSEGRQLDPVVIAGLTDLTRMVNHANNLAGGLDHRDAVAVLRELHKSGYRLPADAIYSWSLAHGWPARGAERLRDLAERIDAGRVVRLKEPSSLRRDIVERWRAEASAK